MENNIPTVLEFLKSTELIIKFDNTQGCILEEELPNLMIEFAKLHVEAFRKELQEKADTFDFEGLEKITDNVYPLSNIK
jgi:hypothetical protein